MSSLSTGAKKDIERRFVDGESPSAADLASPVKKARWDYLFNSLKWLGHRDDHRSQQLQDTSASSGDVCTAFFSPET